ncbi:tigger transposable element-derived protein 4-like [Mauremys reevesii]|uniref:tigger transposable element-derived protein 4-like n=1 Tax=Mauremys reevesii TaxID=260615 RepID=UPI00193FB5B1|nr:tigger transposable element-derived protein 4-like [Mauremys reevesii]
MSGGVKRKLDNQSIEKKYEIILQLEKGTKPADLNRQHGIPANTISGWKKKADVIKQMYEKSVFDPARKKLRVAEHKDVDDALFQWLTNTRATKLPVNGPLLMEKADILAAKLGHPDFKASQGWLDRFKKRHNIVFKAICGESAAVQQEQVDSWLKTQMRTILDTYETWNIFNADETGVFWKCLPDKTMAFRGEACHGGKKSKDRLAVLVAANMDGSQKLPLYVIGKSKNPRCFKQTKVLQCDYDGQPSAWITGDLFSAWVKKWDRKFQAEKRKVALIVDNCRAHPDVPGLKAIKIFYLPPNTTSKLQPMDQGIIQVLKVYYRKMLMRQYLLHDEKKAQYTPSLLDAMNFLRSAWNNVKKETISNCWMHCVIQDISDDEFQAQCRAAAEELAEVAGKSSLTDAILEEEAQELAITVQEFRDYIEIDKDVVTDGVITDEDIVSSVQSAQASTSACGNDKEDEEDADEDLEPIPSAGEVVEMLQKIRRYGSFVGDETVLDSINNIEAFVFKQTVKGKKQQSILDFVKKP